MYIIHIITLIFIFIINFVFYLYSYLSPVIYAIIYFMSNIYLFICSSIICLAELYMASLVLCLIAPDDPLSDESSLL